MMPRNEPPWEDKYHPSVLCDAISRKLASLLRRLREALMAKSLESISSNYYSTRMMDDAKKRTTRGG
ncbi:hypothetical protein CDAR_230941 [Caerostris darwini]|uniref:Uncharacterized protein n=1 Tax=Caerostris darwini TaxID=1538125 RepID=A0AAV4S430_9ARAC|nr:hypothetical protein CDAR_230941 [Caerostris darwini]